MAASKQYAYYLRGQDIAIIQKDYELDGGQTISQPGLNEVGRRGTGVWKSPLEDVTLGLQIEYTHLPDNIRDEESDIDIPHYLALALVYYIKARMSEDGGDIGTKEYFMKEFRKYIEKYENSRIWGTRQAMPGPNAIR